MMKNLVTRIGESGDCRVAGVTVVGDDAEDDLAEVDEDSVEVGMQCVTVCVML